MEYVKLNNGLEMPILGTGTNSFGKVDEDWSKPLTGDYSDFKSSLDVGFRKVDNAIMYNNEDGIGQVLYESGIPREDLFITTKIPHTEDYVKSKEAVQAALDQSLANYHTDYIDLYLLHFPVEEDAWLKNVVEVLEDYYEAGKFKAIGISNHDVEDYERYMSYAKIKPAVNQIQINLETKNQDLIDFYQEEGIQVEAWGPMKASEKQRAALAAIGEAYGKTWAQVLLRYQTQRGISVIPKSHDRKNQERNFESLDFQLTAEEMEAIQQL